MLLENIDVLVDGKFILEERSLNLYFKGSKNQRILDMKESLKQKKAVEIEKYKGEQTKRLEQLSSSLFWSYFSFSHSRQTKSVALMGWHQDSTS